MKSVIIIRQLGLQPYEKVLKAMHLFTEKRNIASNDEIWLVQHPQLFTQGQNGRVEHILNPGNIPVIKTDRGGQVTFHGPGQQIMYVLLNMRRHQLMIRDLITLLEQTVINTLAYFAISACSRAEAPGVYVNADKICSLGLRIRKGHSLHGLALNVAMDLSPFLRINPCGYTGLRMTQVSDLSPGIGIDDVAPILIAQCTKLLETTASKIHSWNSEYYYNI